MSAGRDSVSAGHDLQFHFNKSRNLSFSIVFGLKQSFSINLSFTMVFYRFLWISIKFLSFTIKFLPILSNSIVLG